MVDLEAERLITKTRATVEGLASHLRDLPVEPAQASSNGRPESGSEAAPPIEWRTLTSTVGWKPGPAGFFTGLGWYRDRIAATSS